MAATVQTQPSRLESIVPAFGWLHHYHRSWLSRDLLAGLAAGAVVVPQAMAYATIADIPAEVGLYTCMVPMVLYALLGGSRTLSVSTTSTVAVLTGSTLLAANVAAASDDPARDLATLTLLVGAILVLARVARLGGLIDNISDATLTGIKIGVGLTVAAGQLPKLLGITGDPDATAFVGEVSGVLEDLGDVSWVTVALSAATLAVLVVGARLVPRVPGPLMAVVIGIVLVAVWSIDDHGVALIAPVPSGLPTPVMPSFERLDDLIGGALAIAVMCFLETAAVAASVRRPDEPPIDNDRELGANGLACIGGAFFRAMPSAGGFSQTAISQRAGAVTQVSGLVTVALAVACALFLGGVLSDLPQATLGCMVVVAVVGLIKPSELRRLWSLDRLSFWCAVITAASGLLLGLLAAVLTGVLVTLGLVLRELDRVTITELQPTEDRNDVRVAGSHTSPAEGLLIVRYDAPLYTANVRRAHRLVLAAVDEHHPDTLLIDATALGAVPASVFDRFPDLERELSERDTRLWIASLPPRALTVARTTPRWHEFDDRMYPTALAAVRAYLAAAPDHPRGGAG